MSETTPPTKGLSLLRSLQAEELLQGFAIIGSLKSLQSMATFKDTPFADYIDKLQAEIHGIPEMALWADVDPGVASAYLSTLTRSYETSLDGINRVQIDATCFLGRVRTIHAKATAMKAPFMTLWTIGAQDHLQGTVLNKLSAKDLAALAAMEYTTFLGEADQEWAAIIETVELILDNLKAMRRLAGEKYAMGKDQVNAALTELDGRDLGLQQAPTATRPSTASGVETLKGLFPGRVGAPQVEAATVEVEEDLPAELRMDPVDLEETPLPGPGEPEFPGVCTAEDMAMLEGAFTEPEITPAMVQAAEDLQVGDKVLVVGEDLPLEPGVQEVASVVASRDLALTKPKKGEALVVPFNLNVQAPGTLHVEDFLIGKGKTKFALTAQDNPAENGIYRYMGPDAPLTRIEAALEASKAEPTQEPLPEAKPTHPEPEHRELQVEMPTSTAPDQPKSTMEETILNDPFLGRDKAAEVLAQAKDKHQETEPMPLEDDPLPADVAEPTAPKAAVVDDDPMPGDDLMPAPASPQAAEEDDFPGDVDVRNTTPASYELSGAAAPEPEESEAPSEPETPAPAAPTPDVVAAPAPQVIQVSTAVTKPAPTAAPAATPRPQGGLFRSRVLPAGAAAAPAFQPTKTDALQGAADGLGELM